MSKIHPNEALFPGEKPFPVIAACEHFAGSEKLINKAFELQEKKGPVFDITMDLEDGAPQGREKEHAQMVVAMANAAKNQFKMAGIRIHDYRNPHWKDDVDIVVPGAGNTTAYITIPKPTNAGQVKEMIGYIREVAKANNIKREIPIHVLVETHGALRDAFEIAALPWMQVLDFGLMDFVSGHHGAIPDDCMKSPGQFEHALLYRAKSTVVAAALTNGIVPAHNVTLDLKDAYKTYQDAYRARYEFGFLRMWSIYPTQIDAIVDAMKPDYSKVKTGVEILLLAQENNWGPVQYAGDLHDRATYRYYWGLVQQAKLSGIQLGEKAEQAFFS